MSKQTKSQSPQTSKSSNPPIRVANPAIDYRLRMCLLVLILICVSIFSLASGKYFVSPVDMPALFADLFTQWSADTASWWAALTGADTSLASAASLVPQAEISGDPQAVIAVGQVRFPRVVVCILVGAALSLAGAAYQGMFQNPMASQDVLGASSGAAFGAALGIFVGIGAFGTSLFAFVFGLLAVLASYGISRISKANQILSMVLAGMVISALFSSGTSFLKLVADTENTLPAITYWLMGSLASVRVDDILPVLLLIAVASIPLILLRWRINLLATGEEEARSMGIDVVRFRLLVVVCATFLTATCVSVSGLIGWVGLVIPHFCRLILGNDYRRIIPACMVAGAAFLLIVDDFSRLITTSEIPIGILTSFIGAPVFIWLIVRSGNKGKS